MLNLKKMGTKSGNTICCNDCLFKVFVSKFISKENFGLLYKNSVQVRYAKGEYIIKQGTLSQHVIFLSKGRVKFSYETESGKNVILAISTAPGLLGGFNMINEDHSFFSIIAIEDVEVCLIRIDILKNLVSANSELAVKMVEFVSSIFKDSVYNFISMAHKQVNGRIAGILIYLADTVYRSPKFTLTISRKEISEFANCSLENVIHTLSRLNKEGIISLNNKTIEIVDREKLESISKFG